jgi:hypothetical protein
VLALGLAGLGCGGGAATTGGGAGVGASGGAGGEGGAVGGAGGEGGAACTPTTEICDQLDNDCNGQVDDVAGGCDCANGQEQLCYSGPAGTEDVGVCVGGFQTCDGGTWGPCVGEVLPSAEACNLLDDDCNGVTDELGQETCGVGACQVTVSLCDGGVPGACVPGAPSAEVCDGVDNDCNGSVDEADPELGLACSTGDLGACGPGTWSCQQGALVCVPDGAPTPELCNGLDDNCEGNVDEGNPEGGAACDTGAFGVCQAGIITCSNGGLSCEASELPSPELCNGLDDDCDGAVDQGDPEGGGACDTGQLGVCQPGTLTCSGGALLCAPDQTVSPEVCNGLDDNCDGQVDEGNPGGGGACGCGGAGTLACQGGQLACVGGPTVYFEEDFADNSAGWTLGPNWQIGPAVGGCSGCTGTPDPAQDHTPTDDNGLAGVVIGGPAPTASLHDYYWLESPPFDTSSAPGSVYLSFWRHLNSDYLSYMQNKVQVFDGTSWVDLPYGTTGNCCPGVMDSTWRNHPVPAGAPAQATNSDQYPTQFDLTAYKSAQTRVRFGYRIGSGGVYTIGSWSVDDVVVASEICP